MSITIQQQPSILSPAYNDAIFVVSTSNGSQPSFQFVADLYIGGVKVDRMLVPPHPVHLTGLINIAPLLEGRLTKDILIGDSTIMNNSNSYVAYVVKFGEAYGSTGTVIYPDLTITNTKYVWNSVLDYDDYCSYSSGTYTANVATPCNFLTNKPSSGDIESDDNAWLYWTDLTYLTAKARIKTYTNGVLVNTFDISRTSIQFLRVPSGIKNLNAITTMFTGVETSYTVQILNSSNVAITNLYHYTIVDNCSKYTKTRLQFLNKLGGYDFFNFDLLSKQTVDIDRNLFKKNLGSYTNANAYAFSTKDRAFSQFHTKLKDKFTLNSNWVSEEVMTWLEELVSSPDVLIDDGSSLIPINITATSFEHKKVVNKKLFNLTIEYTLSYDRYRQRI